MAMQNRVDCPTCHEEGQIETFVHTVTGKRYYMCDKCKDVWDSLEFDTSHCLTWDAFLLENNTTEEDYSYWEYVIK